VGPRAGLDDLKKSKFLTLQGLELEELSTLKKSYDLIGNRILDLPACSLVPEPTTLPRAPPQKVVPDLNQRAGVHNM
jgi:hypothetical protein